MRHDRASEVLAERLAPLAPIVINLNDYLRKYETYTKRKIRRSIRQAFEAQDLRKTPLVVYGSGDYHHYTYGLCREVADKRSAGYSYIHIDQHTDFGSPREFRPKKSDLCCGDFVAQIVEDTNAKSSTHIGQDFTWNLGSVARGTKFTDYMFSMHLKDNQMWFRKIRDMLSWTKPEVYVTIDLDVLTPPFIRTDYENGDLTLPQLLQTIRKIKQRRKIVGLDICGLTDENEIDERSIQTHVEIINCVRGVRK